MGTLLRNDRRTLSASLLGVRVELSRALYDLPGLAEYDARRDEIEGYLDRVEEVSSILYDVRVDDAVEARALAYDERQAVLNTLRRAARAAERQSEGIARAKNKVEKAARALGVVEEGLEALLKLLV